MNITSHILNHLQFHSPDLDAYAVRCTLASVFIRPFVRATVVRQDQILQLHLHVDPLIVGQAGPHVVGLRHLMFPVTGEFRSIRKGVAPWCWSPHATSCDPHATSCDHSGRGLVRLQDHLGPVRIHVQRAEDQDHSALVDMRRFAGGLDV